MAITSAYLTWRTQQESAQTKRHTCSLHVTTSVPTLCPYYFKAVRGFSCTGLVRIQTGQNCDLFCAGKLTHTYGKTRRIVCASPRNLLAGICLPGLEKCKRVPTYFIPLEAKIQIVLTECWDNMRNCANHCKQGFVYKFLFWRFIREWGAGVMCSSESPTDQGGRGPGTTTMKLGMAENKNNVPLG